MESLFLITAIVGLVELVKAVKVADWEKCSIIIGSAVIGGISGYFGVNGLNVVTGIQAGLAASGTYRLGQVVGDNY